ncbi:MAG: hypothetical protein AAFU85_26805 [Planctomycetota bacterium]
MKMLTWILPGALAVLAGCNGSSEPSPTITTTIESEYLATSEAPGAMPVGKAREGATNDQKITLIGRIGGSAEPFVSGLAAFTVVDPKVPCCSPEEGCPKPWDYCCAQDQVQENIATVKIVDEAGKTVEQDARQLLGATELSTVVVEGTARRDAEGNLTIAARKVFVRPNE